YANLTEAVVNYLQAVGIRVKLRPLERAAYFKGYAEKSYRNLIQGQSGGGGADRAPPPPGRGRPPPHHPPPTPPRPPARIPPPAPRIAERSMTIPSSQPAVLATL